jgi:uncharacterized protein YdeI (YjbR/CyaY-like superfamily)
MKTPEKELETFYPACKQEWRQWLQEHHDKKQSVWIIQYRKKSNIPSITWSDAVDEALCFGWIDSTARTINAEQFMQFFTRRKPKSVWSKINKEKVARLLEQNLIAPAGLAVIEIAKQNGSWTILDEVEEVIVPPDLQIEFNNHSGSSDYFLSLSRSVRKAILQWLVLAKRPETRQKRIKEIAELAALKQKPKQF